MEGRSKMEHDSQNDNLLYTRNLGKQFNGVKVLQDINLTIRKGEIHCILGANGAGKSTLIKIIDGIYTDYDGEIYVKNEKVQPANTEEARLLGIGMVHQELSLVSQLNVAENIYLGRLPMGKWGLVNYRKLHQDSEHILRELGMQVKTTEMVSHLSIADRQMIEIAKMLSMNAEIILLDEPTSALTEKEVQRLFITMENLKKQGKGIIFITHKLEEIYATSDRVTILRDGNQIATIDLGTEDPSLEMKLISLMTGTDQGEVGDIYPEKSNKIGNTVLEVVNFNSKGKFEDIHFHVRSGEILGISGLKGAGRTELARAIFGADPKDRGRLKLNGQEIHVEHTVDAIHLGIGMVSEDRKKEGFVGPLGVRENISLTNIRDVLFRGMISRRLEKEKTRTYISKLNIRMAAEDAQVKNLSGGNQQKVVIAKWLCTDCKVLILDEPTRGIDVKAKSEIYKIMSELAEQGMAILFISSELPELIAMSDRVLVMSRGRIVSELAGAQISKENIMKSTFQETSQKEVV
jgi:ribose transport system ATP-binding protein